MSLTIMTPILITFMLLTVLSAARKGYKKGSTKSAIQLAIVVGSAFIGVGLSMLLAHLLTPSVLSLLEDLDFISSVEDAIGAFAIILDPFVKMIVNFILFLPSYLAVYLLIKAVVSIIIAARAKKQTKTDDYYSENVDYYTKSSKRLGAFFGAATGLFLAILTLSPLVGIFKCARTTTDVIIEFSEMDEDELLSEEFEDALDLSEDFMVTAIDACGGRMWFNLSTSCHCYGQWTNINREIAFFADIGMEEMTEVMESISNLDDDSFDALEDFLEKTKESSIVTLMLTAAVNDMSKAWIDGTTFMDIPKPEIGEGYVNDFFDEILTVLSKTTTSTVEEDLSTLLGLCDILRDYDYVFDSDNYEIAADTFADGKLLEKIKKELKKNPRMSSLEALVDNIIMGSLAVEIEIMSELDPESQDELFDSLTEMINSSVSVSNEKRAKALSTDIYAALSDYGVYAPEEMVDEVAKILISSLSAGGQTVTRAQVEAYFNSYQNQN